MIEGPVESSSIHSSRAVNFHGSTPFGVTPPHPLFDNQLFGIWDFIGNFAVEWLMRGLSRAVFSSLYICIGMIEVKDIEQAVATFAEQHEGYFLVRAEVKSNNRIEVEVDHDTAPVDIDTIVALSRHIEVSLDREKEDFELEVSSAGLTTPLEGVRRYRKFVGRELEVLLKSGVKEVGLLECANEEGFVLVATRMERPEGERRRRPVEHRMELKYEEVKKAVYNLKV